LGADVLRLVRINVGGVVLGDLPRGAVRHLTPAEKGMLDVPARAFSTPLRPRPAGSIQDR
jgi:23S rRNA pseudouridine2605 synthase